MPPKHSGLTGPDRTGGEAPPTARSCEGLKAPDPITDFFDSKELAAHLRVHPVTLCKWRREGGGPPYIRICATRVLYDRLDVDKWLKNRKFANYAAETAAS
jgi:hypothetical protein